MSDDASAYAALGLEPDADDAEIEQAYKRLIKEHHPDREARERERAEDEAAAQPADGGEHDDRERDPVDGRHGFSLAASRLHWCSPRGRSSVG